MPFVEHRCSLTDDLDVGTVALHFTVEGTVYPSEDAVRYYPDESGYPGCSSDFEVEKIICEKAVGDNWEFIRDDRPDWFKDLDRIITDRVFSNPDYERECLEKLVVYED